MISIMGRNKVRKGLILLFWLAVWQGVSLWMDRPILLVGPLETAAALVRMAAEGDFWRAVFSSLARIGCGFGLAFLAGLILGTAACLRPFLEELLAPVVAGMKAIPVASFVILALIWAGADRLTLVVSFLVVFPMIYLNTLAGLRAADPALLEMCRVFRVKWPARAWHIYRPALAPYLLSASQVALGRSWKSGVAAEVIGTPDYSIGEQLYMAKIYFTTDELLAWTAVVIALSFLFEKVIFALLKKGMEVRP